MHVLDVNSINCFCDDQRFYTGDFTTHLIHFKAFFFSSATNFLLQLGLNFN